MLYFPIFLFIFNLLFWTFFSCEKSCAYVCVCVCVCVLHFLSERSMASKSRAHALSQRPSLAVTSCCLPRGPAPLRASPAPSRVPSQLGLEWGAQTAGKESSTNRLGITPGILEEYRDQTPGPGGGNRLKESRDKSPQIYREEGREKPCVNVFIRQRAVNPPFFPRRSPWDYFSLMFSFMGLMNGTTDTHTNVSCTCNCKRSTSFQSMAISEYQFLSVFPDVTLLHRTRRANRSESN